MFKTSIGVLNVASSFQDVAYHIAIWCPEFPTFKQRIAFFSAWTRL